MQQNQMNESKKNNNQKTQKNNDKHEKGQPINKNSQPGYDSQKRESPRQHAGGADKQQK